MFYSLVIGSDANLIKLRKAILPDKATSNLADPLTAN